MKETDYPAGTKISKACENLYNMALHTEIPQMTSFNGVRIIMFNDAYDIAAKRDALKEIKALCGTTDDRTEIVSKIADIVRDLY